MQPLLRHHDYRRDRGGGPGHTSAAFDYSGLIADYVATSRPSVFSDLGARIVTGWAGIRVRYGH